MEKPSIERFGRELSELFRANRMVVFLCGPSLEEKDPKPGAVLRKRLQSLLEKEGFEVVLGEDDGLEWLRKKYLHMAHLNELAFVRQECGAIVLIADSVGSFCELGLFSYVHPEYSHKTDFILIVDAQHEPKPSYLNEGPARAVRSHGLVIYTKLDGYDGKEVLRRLEDRRALYVYQGRGRPGK